MKYILHICNLRKCIKYVRNLFCIYKHFKRLKSLQETIFLILYFAYLVYLMYFHSMRDVSFKGKTILPHLLNVKNVLFLSPYYDNGGIFFYLSYDYFDRRKLSLRLISSFIMIK